MTWPVYTGYLSVGLLVFAALLNGYRNVFADAEDDTADAIAFGVASLLTIAFWPIALMIVALAGLGRFLARDGNRRRRSRR